MLIESEYSPNGLYHIFLNNPANGNALNLEYLQALHNVLKACPLSARALLVSSKTKHFCLGADLKELHHLQNNSTELLAYAETFAELLFHLYHLSIPTICYAQGAVYGGGLGLLAACDWVVAHPALEGCFSELRLGMFPALISPYVIERIGLAQSKFLFFSAKKFSAQEGLAWGLYNGLANTYADCLHSIAPLLHNAPERLALSKEWMLAQYNHCINEPTLQDTVDAFVAMAQSAEAKEGVAAFLEKQQPGWVRNV